MSRHRTSPSIETESPPADPARRKLLKAGSGLLLVAAAGGCTAEEIPIDLRPRVALASLPLGSRQVVLLGTRPVELLREEDGVRARSLLCRHRGCRVRWSTEKERYLCACHGGEYDAEGKPVAGPPQRPLLEIPTTLEEGTVVVGDPE